MSCGLSRDLSNVHSHTDIYILWPVSHSTTQKVLVLLFFIYPVTQNVCLEIFRELTQLYCLLQDVDNVQNAVNSLSVIWMYNIQNIQSTINLSRWCIQFTPVKVHSNTSYIIFQNTIALLIASEYKVHLWSDVHSLYTFTDFSGTVQNQLKKAWAI